MDSYSNSEYVKIKHSFKSSNSTDFFIFMEFKSKEYLEIIRTVNDIYNHSSGNITRVVPFSKDSLLETHLNPIRG